MMGLGGANRLGIHARMCRSCVGKYYASNFVRTGGHPYDGFNDRFLIMSCMCLHSLTSIVGSLTKYSLKYSSHVLLLFHVKARHLYTAGDEIAIKDHGTCIRQWYFIS